MNNVMWIQSDDPMGKDYLFVDGHLISEEDEPLRAESMAKLLKAQDVKYVNTKTISDLRDIAGTPNFTLSYSPRMGILYKSIFNEKASDGRNKAFVLWCTVSEKDNVWGIATANSKQLNYTLRENERSIINNYLNDASQKNKMKNAAVLGGIVFLLVILSYVVK